MIARFALVLLVAVAISGNPFANTPWRWIHRRLTASPNFKPLPVENVAKSFVLPRPRYPSGTVKVENCGQAPLAPAADPAIVGGWEAPPHSFPWQVALSIDSMYFCGGSIISEDWIMTAAHCMNGARSVSIVAGAHDLYVNEPSQVTMVSRDFFVHEQWNPTTFSNDIAMIRLPQKLTFNDYIQPVCLPSPDSDDLPEYVVVIPTGWGSTGYGGTVNTLREVTDYTISNEVCAQGFGNIITENIICIDGSQNRGTCNGDSGGPLNYQVGSRTETRGITSFGSAAGCLSGYPDAFTRVTHYLGWIRDHTGVTS